VTALAVLAVLAAGVIVVRALRPASTTAGRTIGKTRQVLPVVQRPVFPVLDGTDLDGRRLSTKPWRGKVLVVNFWGSWCAPCRKEAPVLRRVSQESYAQGVRFVGVDIRDNPGAGKAFERTYKITYPSFNDPDAGLGLRLGSLGPQATPSTYVVDRKGRIAAVFYGATTYDELHSAVELVVENG
jgi:thiol-disulfide isomerase/thioredoxin